MFSGGSKLVRGGKCRTMAPAIRHQRRCSELSAGWREDGIDPLDKKPGRRPIVEDRHQDRQWNRVQGKRVVGTRWKQGEEEKFSAEPHYSLDWGKRKGGVGCAEMNL